MLAPGDVLLRVGERDLAGLMTPLTLSAPILEAALTEHPVPLELRRGTLRMQVLIDLRRHHPITLAPVWTVLTSIAYVCTAVLILLRVPDAPASRYLFAGLLSANVYFAALFPGPSWQTVGNALVRAFGAMLVAPCLIGAMMRLVPQTAPRTRLGLGWPWLLSLLALLTFSGELLDMPLPADVTWRWIDPLTFGAFALSILAVLTRGFVLADPIGRRRIKWVVYGSYLLYVPYMLRAAAIVLDGRFASLDTPMMALGGMVLPVCLLVAILRFNLFDIDRLISVTASYTVLAVVALAVVLVVFPRAAALASDGLGVDRGTGQLAFSLILAGILVPTHRWLRPQIDRLFFRDRYALEHGVSALLRELSECDAPTALCELVGERLDSLVRPDACVVYTRSGEVFTPIFARGRGIPAAFETNGGLAAALAHRRVPLVAQARQQRRVANLEGLDRAALDTLGVAAVLPVHRGDELVAFVCLGAKRSGDIYTETDLTLLEAVAGKLSDELLRYDLAEVVQKGRIMEEALRRYVPVAVTSQLASGGIQPAEHEIAVLFVDIRGYTTFAATRRAAEVFATVNRYAETVSAIARAHGGAVAEFGGDGMMVVFGAPQRLAGKENAAVTAGREIIDAVAALTPDGDDGGPLLVGVGIATGVAYVGDVRSVERHIWTAIGDTVNLAARLQQLTRSLSAAMVIDAPTKHAASSITTDFVCHAQTPIRGRPDPEDVWVLPTTAITSQQP